MSAEYMTAWTASLIGILQRSGAPVQDPPVTDDVPLAAKHLGVDVLELLETVDLEVKYRLATVQN